MNKLTLLLLLGTISKSDAILLNKKEVAKAAESEKVSKDWNMLADVVNDKEYMKTQMSALEEQDMHNTDKYTMSAPEFFKKMGKDALIVAPKPKKQLVEVKTVTIANTTSNATANVTANATQNATFLPFLALSQGNTSANASENANKGAFSEINAVIASNETANATANVTIQTNSTTNKSANATVAFKKPATNAIAQANLTLDQEKQVKIGQILQSHSTQKEQERMISDIDDQYERKKKEQDEYEQTKTKAQIVTQVDIEAQADKLTAEALIEKSEKDQEQKKVDDKIKGLSKLDQEAVTQIDQLNKAVDNFSRTLDESEFKKAMQIKKDLRSQNLAQGETRLMVHTTDVFEAGFTKFPQIAKNEYVQDQITYLDAAQDNLNNNQDNESLLENFIARAKEVSQNLQNQYPDQWESPLKV